MSDILLAQISLVAYAVPTWTDKEVLYAVGGTLGVMIPVAWGVMQLLTYSARSRAEKAETEQKRLKRQLAMAVNNDEVVQLQERIERAEKEKEEAKNKLTNLQADLKCCRDEADGLHQVGVALRAERETLERKLNDAQEELVSEQRRVNKALQRDGTTWTEKVLQTKFVEFKPLDPETRRTPIISVLNLKGGVGKTTTTANLGAAMANLGYRVLLVDLDLQGSLTGMFLSDREVDELVESQCLLEDFLTASFDAEFPNLLNYIRPIGLPNKSMLVPTTDNLAYAETNLTVRWFLRDSNRDPRLLLRKELHLKRVTERFDVILLDCPPLINVSCVNALAASDFVLIPVMPSKQATERVTILLERLKEFKNINPDLDVMGFFANRTNGSTLTTDELNRLTALRNKCHDAWGSPVALFNAFIRQSVDSYQNTRIPPNHTRFTITTREDPEPIELVIKMPQNEAIAAESKPCYFGFEFDCRTAVLVTLIKSAFLTLFLQHGYRFAISASGTAIGRFLLGDFFLENKSKEMPEIKEALKQTFIQHKNTVRPVTAIAAGLKREGTLTDFETGVCYGSSGDPFAEIVLIRIGKDFFGVLVPGFEKAHSAAAFHDFLNNDNEKIMVRRATFDPESQQFKINPALMEVRWPKEETDWDLEQPTGVSVHFG
jgi:chromosome partitioning protein